MVPSLDHRGPMMELSMRALKCLDEWLKRFVWMAQITLALYVVVAAHYISDRTPPFAVLHVDPAEARPGEPITITAHVWRDSSRDCSAQFSRYLFDQQHIRFDLPADDAGRPYYASDKMIDRIEAETPGIVKITFTVPPGMGTGAALLQTELQYSCNQMHRIWPIEVTTRMPFTVLP